MSRPLTSHELEICLLELLSAAGVPVVPRAETTLDITETIEERMELLTIADELKGLDGAMAADRFEQLRPTFKTELWRRMDRDEVRRELCVYEPHLV